MPLATRLPCISGPRYAYESIPEEEEDDDLSDVMDYAPRPEAGWWKGAWPVGVSLLLFTAAFVGSGLASRKASTPQHAMHTATHFRGQDRGGAMRLHAQTSVMPTTAQASLEEEEEDTSCVANSQFSFTVSECSCDADKVVLGGADPVAYFSMSEGDPYVLGSAAHSATLNGYTFYFSSSENQALFEASPWKYSPSFGAFCAWGMAEERSPDYNWEPSNLGPSVDLTLWLVRNDRLFLFYKAEAMEKFLVDPDQFMLDGDERWSGWYGSKEQSPFNTDCYVQEEIEGDTVSTKVKEEQVKGEEEVKGGMGEGGEKDKSGTEKMDEASSEGKGSEKAVEEEKSEGDTGSESRGSDKVQEGQTSSGKEEEKGQESGEKEGGEAGSQKTSTKKVDKKGDADKAVQGKGSGMAEAKQEGGNAGSSTSKEEEEGKAVGQKKRAKKVAQKGGAVSSNKMQKEGKSQSSSSKKEGGK